MKKNVKKLLFLTALIMLFMLSAMTAAAAETYPNSAGGFSVPATMTIQVGETKKFSVTEPAGKYGNVAIQYTPTYVDAGDFEAGSYWGKKAYISLTGIDTGEFYAIATVEAHTKAGDPNSEYARYTLYCKVRVVNSTKIPLKSISLNKSSSTLNVGSTLQLKPSYSPSNTTDSKTVTWTSNHTSIATVSGGKVTAKKPGTAIITAKVGSKKATCKVTVKAPLKSISLNKTSSTLNVGSSLQLTTSFSPSNTTDSKTVTWTSNHTSIATVSGGKVTAKKPGTAIITAKVGSKKATCTVTVKAPLKSISLNKTSSTLNAGKTLQLNVAYSPSNTTDSKTVKWTSNHTSIATVSGGKVTAKKPGTAIITAKVGSKKATCTVTVKEAQKAITLSKSSVSVNKGSSVTLSVTSNTIGTKTVTWSSSNTAVATVSGGKITGKKPGTATITAKAGSKTATCKVTVKAPLKSIALNKNSSTLNVGSTLQLSVTYNPTNTTDSKTVAWSSSNTAVVTVSGGKITAKKPGTATVTAKVGTRTATCKVTVKAPLKSISLNKTSASINEGSSLTLTVSFNPTNTTDSKTVAWSSSNTAVATVSSGKITAKKAGTATITAKVGTKTATCKITVKTSSSDGTDLEAGSYKDVSDAYSILNTWRTTKENQWYWNSSNTSKITTYGLKAISRDPALENTAKQRAKEAWYMYYVKGKATHDRPDGSSCSTAYPSGLHFTGENLAWGHSTSLQVITDPNYGWAETNSNYNGQGHRRAMLNSNFTKVGIACYVKDGRTCWAMSFGG